jgi:NitT/TauT family transport system ATP-binding protein
VLTAENLRGDLLDLWTHQRMRAKGIFFVTHNIEEAALMADRIVILGHNPGQILADLRVNIPSPRNAQGAQVRKVIDELYTLMTTQEKTTRVWTQDTLSAFAQIDRFHRLPNAEISELTGLLEQIVDYEMKSGKTGPIDLPVLSDELNMDSDVLFPLTEALEILRFAKVSKGDISPTKEGRDFTIADILTRKQIFARQLINYVPLAQHIRHTLDIRENHLENEDFFLSELEEKLSKNEADRVLRIIIDWARYAEIFAYNYHSGNLSLENP